MIVINYLNDRVDDDKKKFDVRFFQHYYAYKNDLI
jgi:hypothetical protein